VFLIGEESLLLDQDGDAGRDPDPTIAIEGPGGRSSRRPRPHRLPATLQGARGLALLGLAVGAPVLAALRPWGGGGPDRPAHTVSPRSPLISRSAAGAPARRTVRAHPPAVRHAEVHRPGVVHHHRRPRRPEAPASPRPQVTQTEPEREPIPQVAPVSSSAVTTTTKATPVSEPGPASTADPTPPSPPPSSSGGGPGGVGDPRPSAHGAGVETFGFER
jgi:hypothetical protein